MSKDFIVLGLEETTRIIYKTLYLNTKREGKQLLSHYVVIKKNAH